MLICLDAKKKEKKEQATFFYMNCPRKKKGQATFSVRKKTVINRGQNIIKRDQENGARPHFSGISPFSSCQGKNRTWPHFLQN